MTDTPDLENFADVFAEALTPENRAALDALGPDADMKTIWEKIVLRNYVRVSKPKMFVGIRSKELIGDGAFSDLHVPIVNGIVGLSKDYRDKPVKYAVADMRLPRASEAIYEPGLGDWPTRTKFNMYRPAGFAPLEGRPEIILAHIRYLFPDKWERSLVIAYLKWMVQRPQDKMQFALLIIGKYGVGKSWFSTFFQTLFGEHNVLVLEKGERIASNFNKLEENRQVIFVDELCPGGTADLARAIEPKIVGKAVTIEPKGVDPFTVPNRYNVVSISNYETAIKLKTKRDRKWLVVRATSRIWGADLESPEREAEDYYNRLFDVTKVGDTAADVTDEMRRALWWLSTMPISQDWDTIIDPAMVDVDGGEILLSDFNGRGVAPLTDTKEEVAALSETTIESTLNGAFERGTGPFRFELFSVKDVRLAFVAEEAAFTASEHRSRNQIDGDIGSVLDDLKCERIGSRRQIYIGPERKRLWFRNSKLLPKYQAMTNKQLTDAYVAERRGKKPDPSADAQADFEE
jgi:hypothetical protein